MYSKTHQSFILIFLFCIVCIPQRTAFAETRYSNKTFSQSILLKRANHPYYFSGQNIIPNGVTVTVEKGAEIFVDGNITVFGKLALAGETISHIQIKQSDSFDGVGQVPLTVIGGELHASYVDFQIQ